LQRMRLMELNDLNIYVKVEKLKKEKVNKSVNHNLHYL
jgi:hypothetical protein